MFDFITSRFTGQEVVWLIIIGFCVWGFFKDRNGKGGKGGNGGGGSSTPQ